MAIRVKFALSEQKIHQNISKKQNQNSLLVARLCEPFWGEANLNNLASK
jgi:hypothetical protein